MKWTDFSTLAYTLSLQTGCERRRWSFAKRSLLTDCSVQQNLQQFSLKVCKLTNLRKRINTIIGVYLSGYCFDFEPSRHNERLTGADPVLQAVGPYVD